MCAARGERGGGSVENTSDFLESQQVTIERQGLLQVLHIEHDVAEVMSLHEFTFRT